MNLANIIDSDTSIDEDAELEVLGALLSAPDDFQLKGNGNQKPKQTEVPKENGVKKGNVGIKPQQPSTSSKEKPTPEGPSNSTKLNTTNEPSVNGEEELMALEALLCAPDDFQVKGNGNPVPKENGVQKGNVGIKPEKPCSSSKGTSSAQASSSSSKLNTTIEPTIDDDEELLALEALLSAPDEQATSGEKTQPTAGDNQKTTLSTKPTIREDSSFADAFSYEIDASVETAAVKAAREQDENDSSDDEDIRNFLERKYNEYGKDINKKLKQQRQEKWENSMAHEVDQALKEPQTSASSDKQNEAQIKNPHQPKIRQSLLSNSFKKISDAQVAKKEEKPTPNPSFPSQAPPSQPAFTDPVFGLRIINPLISSTLLIERMAGRKSVPVSYIPIHIERGDLTKDWVFAGAVVSKSPTQTTKKGQPYSIWKISDLRGEIKLVSLFLFSGAHKHLWKTSQGMCIAVLNPTIFEKRAKSDEIACLSIDTPQKVLILGQSKDLGICKAKKRNGENCTSIVNLSECDYCIFHMKQEYGKLARRSELQSTSGGINELRNKVLGKSEVFYAGQSYTAIPAKKSAKLTSKDNQRMSALSDYGISPFASSVNHASKQKLFNKPVPYAKSNVPVSKVASNVEVNTKQRQKDMERLSILMAENEKNENKKDEAAARITSTQESSTRSETSCETPDKFKNREFSFLARTPKLSNENFCIEVNIGDKRAQQARQKAAKLLKQKPIEKVNPNSIRGSKAGKRRAIDELNEKFCSHEFKRQRLEEEQRANDRKSRLQRIMDATSSHANLVDLRELQEQEKYFDKQEKKEALEEKMLNTYKVPCKAVICQRCKYTAFSAADRCKEEKHPLKIIDAEKRFFQCKDCGNRTATVFKIPKTSCKTCQSSRWERAAMIRERKLCTTGENLSVRGDEEAFLGSLASSANLNLLVPEE